jgi:hypothetical protein
MYPEVGLLDNTEIFNFLRSCHISVVAELFYIPMNSVHRDPISPHPLQRLLHLGSSYPDGCEVVSHCGFDLHFSNDSWYWAPLFIFSCAYWSFVYLLLEACLLKSFQDWLFTLVPLFPHGIQSCLCTYRAILKLILLGFRSVYGSIWGSWTSPFLGFPFLVSSEES